MNQADAFAGRPHVSCSHAKASPAVQAGGRAGLELDSQSSNALEQVSDRLNSLRLSEGVPWNICSLGNDTLC